MPAFDHIHLHTERLLLRPLIQANASAMFATFSDPQVTRYWSTPPWDAIGQAQAFIASDMRAMAAGEYVRLGLERVADKRVLGFCTLFHWVEKCRRAEIGYGMASDAWGLGYMNEALLRLLEFGFTELDLNRIEGDVDPRNVASTKSLERLGFKQEGLLRERWIVGGEVSDTALYGLLRSEWQTSRRAG